MEEAQGNHDLQVSNPERIARIFRRIVETKLQVFMRAAPNQNVIVKGRAVTMEVALDAQGIDKSTFIVNQISEKGAQYLLGKKVVQIEFIMLSSKIVANCAVVQCQTNAIILRLPTLLRSLERRADTRYQTRDDALAYASLSVMDGIVLDLTAPPFFSHGVNLAKYLRVGDISLGGMCLTTPFPIFQHHILRNMVDAKCKLMFPMSYPQMVKIDVRWIKRAHNRISAVSTAEASLPGTTYLFGCRFLEPSEEFSQIVKRFIQKILDKQAI